MRESVASWSSLHQGQSLAPKRPHPIQRSTVARRCTLMMRIGITHPPALIAFQRLNSERQLVASLLQLCDDLFRRDVGSCSERLVYDWYRTILLLWRTDM